MTILITGANGFVGTAVCTSIRERGMDVRTAVRIPKWHSGDEIIIEEIGPNTDWSAALVGVDAVIHLAARVHVMRDCVEDPLAAFREVNTSGTETLARQAAQVGVRRLVYVSSVKVLGESTTRSPFRANDLAAPEDAYGVSKWEAEGVLKNIAMETGLEVVIVRPPLVYGPGVKGNFPRLVRLVERGIPLPLGRVRNKRSLVAIDNLVDLLIRCIDHPAAAGETFLVSDDEDLSTPDLIRRIAKAMNKQACLVSLPVSLLRLAGRLSDRATEVERLVSSLQVDIGHTRQTLDWRPPISVDEGLRRAVVR